MAKAPTKADTRTAADFSSTKDTGQLQKVEVFSAAEMARSEVHAMAAFLGVDPKRLLRCLLSSVNFRTMLQCFRSGDVLGCLMESVDLQKVLECVLEQVPNGGEFSSEFE